jgi:hypothetical protein
VTTPRPALRRSLAAIAVALMAALVGVLVGNNLSWGSKSLTVERGTAVLLNKATGLASFKGEDGTDPSFDADSVFWSNNGVSGDGSPPCLRSQNRPVSVDAGYTWVELPGGGSSPVLVWLRCP